MRAASKIADDAVKTDPVYRGYRANASVPAVLKWFVPEPEIGLLGCKPFVPLKPGAACDLCEGCVKDIPATIDGEPGTVVICLQCHRMDPRWEPLVAKQVAEANAAEDAETRSRRDAEWLKDEVLAIKPDEVFSEVDRRRIWLGCDGLLSSRPGLSINAAKLGREFLAGIGQPPDWGLILDRFGIPVGRHENVSSDDYESTSHADPGDGGEVWNAKSSNGSEPICVPSPSS